MNNHDPSCPAPAGEAGTGRMAGAACDAEPSLDVACQHLVQRNRLLRELVQIIQLPLDFAALVERVLALLKPLLPVAGLEFYTLMEPGKPLHLAPETGFHGNRADPPAACLALLGGHPPWQGAGDGALPLRLPQTSVLPDGTGVVQALVWPLCTDATDPVRSLVLLRLTEAVVLSAGQIQALHQLSRPLGVAVEREALLRVMDAERQQSYERVIRDTLTGLYSRHYMQESMTRLCQVHNRDPNATIVVAAFSVDHFAAIRDAHGHATGDGVLRRVARILMDNCRSVDLPVRLGGEEFMLFIIGSPREVALHITERIRERVSQLAWEAPMQEQTVTVRCGVAFRAVQEPIAKVMERADLALYQAKKGGGNRVVVGS